MILIVPGTLTSKSGAHSVHLEAGAFHMCILGLLGGKNGPFEDLVPCIRANAISPFSFPSFQLISAEGTEK